MPIEPIDPKSLAQVLGDQSIAGTGRPAAKPASGNFFEDMLNKAVESLEGVSAVELKTNALIQGYMDGKVDLADAVTAASELNILVQLTVTVANQAITSFKELTSIPI